MRVSAEEELKVKAVRERGTHNPRPLTVQVCARALTWQLAAGDGYQIPSSPSSSRQHRTACFVLRGDSTCTTGCWRGRNEKKSFKGLRKVSALVASLTCVPPNRRTIVCSVRCVGNRDEESSCFRRKTHLLETVKTLLRTATRCTSTFCPLIISRRYKTSISRCK